MEAAAPVRILSSGPDCPSGSLTSERRQDRAPSGTAQLSIPVLVRVIPPAAVFAARAGAWLLRHRHGGPLLLSSAHVLKEKLFTKSVNPSMENHV
jgi:hypothetical protein